MTRAHCLLVAVYLLFWVVFTVAFVEIVVNLNYKLKCMTLLNVSIIGQTCKDMESSVMQMRGYKFCLFSLKMRYL